MLRMWIYWDNIHTIKKSTENFIDASKVVGLEVNTEKTKYMLLSRHQNAGKNREIKTASRWFENMAYFKYVGWNFNSGNYLFTTDTK
jgi:hypothetical protein